MNTFILKNLALLTLVFVFYIQSAFPRVHDYETTRLKSTAGAGVASILLDESVALNPAPLAFYNSSSLYFHLNKSDISSESFNNQPKLASDSDDVKSLIISDAKGPLKGSLSYHDQREGIDLRKRFSAAFGHPVGPQSAIGFGYRYTKDSIEGQSKEEENKYHQMTFGMIHALSPEFSIGAVVVDPLKSIKEDNRFSIGMQYLYKKFISLMIDGGSDYNQDLSDRLFYKTAIQFKVFQDFYVRLGTFRDKYLMEKGNGIGLSWIGPRLAMDLAFKNTSPTGTSLSDISYNTEVKETSFSLSYLF